MKRLTKNDLTCPYPPSKNKDFDELFQHSLEWLSASGCLKSDIIQRCSEEKLSLFTARAFPDASFPVLPVIDHWMIWAILLDDLLDENLSSSQIKDYSHTIEQIILQGHPIDTSPSLPPYIFIFHSLWIDIEPYLNHVTRLRFSQHIIEHIHSRIDESQVRNQRVFLSIKEYIENRHHIAGACIAFDLYEIASNQVLSDEEYSDSLLQELIFSASKITGWINDIFSLEKEEKQGDTSNLVLVVKHEKRCDREDAIHEVVKMVEEEERHFQQIASTFLTSPLISPQKQSYLEGLQYCISATHYWSIESPRYH